MFPRIEVGDADIGRLAVRSEMHQGRPAVPTAGSRRSHPRVTPAFRDRGGRRRAARAQETRHTRGDGSRISFLRDCTERLKVAIDEACVESPARIADPAQASREKRCWCAVRRRRWIERLCQPVERSFAGRREGDHLGHHRIVKRRHLASGLDPGSTRMPSPCRNSSADSFPVDGMNRVLDLRHRSAPRRRGRPVALHPAVSAATAHRRDPKLPFHGVQSGHRSQ